MLPVRRSTTRRAILALVTAGLLLGLASVPALAKGPILEASFEQPISFESPPGSELLVVVNVTVDEAFEGESAVGAPVWLRLIGPTGDTTEAAGATGTGAGRYEMRIIVPEGGPRRLQVYMPGGPGESDLELWLMNDPFTFKPMGEGTAQVAAPRPPMGPYATKAPAPAPVTTAAAALATPTSEPAAGAFLVGLLVVAGSAMALAALVRTRRSSRRGAASPAIAPIDAPTRPSGA